MFLLPDLRSAVIFFLTMSGKEANAREEVMQILTGRGSDVPDDIRELLDSQWYPRVDARLAACVIILLRRIEAIEGELNPEDE